MTAAATVFAEVGVQRASVAQITDRAGFTRGAFYSNFESKESALLALLQQVAAAQIGAVRSQVRSFREGDSLEWRSRLRRLLDGVTFHREDVMLLMEMQLYAVRSATFGQRYALVLLRLEGEVSHAIHEFAAAEGVSLRVGSLEASRTLCSLWLTAAAISTAERAHHAEITVPEECHVLVEALFAP